MSTEEHRGAAAEDGTVEAARQVDSQDDGFGAEDRRSGADGATETSEPKVDINHTHVDPRSHTKAPGRLKRTSNAVADDLSRHERNRQNTHRSDKLILEKFALYKTESRYYVTACNQSDSRYRVLKIDRHYSPTDEVHELHITEDATIYSAAQLQDLLRMIEDGNKTTGGCQKVIPVFYGIVGFIRFTAGWYAVLIKQRAAVALIGGHYIYHCEESVIVPISANAKPANAAEESRLLSAFQQVDLSKNFYFSYTYDLTNTLQTNLTRPSTVVIREQLRQGEQVQHVADHAFHEGVTEDTVKNVQPKSAWGFNDKFVWNQFLLQSAFSDTIGPETLDAELDQPKERSCWVLPMVHGFVDQAKINIFGRVVYITLIARRSRYFAGARFLKRGVNDEGNVANDVESEQIVADGLTTSFYTAGGATAGPQLRPTPHYTSFVQHRGSIPLSWQQDTSQTSMKPPIELHLIDPYHSAAALHFDDLFCRYGAPIIALNLIKTRESEARESKLIKPFKECIDYLNQFLPGDKRIRYIPFDMSAAYKSRTTDVIGVLEDIAEEVLETTGFFHSGPEAPTLTLNSDGNDELVPPYRSVPSTQEGVCRTNCIDCLDRTNAAQFVIAKAAFGHQLHALGIVANPHLAYDTDAVNMLTEMFHDHGDTIALQYGGSHLVNTMNTYRKINQWRSHSRDMVEGLKRFYANVALDQDKQNSINLFLGIREADYSNSVLRKVSATLGSFSFDDSFLAKTGNLVDGAGTAFNGANEKSRDPEHSQSEGGHSNWVPRGRRDYRGWFTKEYLTGRLETAELERRMQEAAKEDADVWVEYYRPRLFTQFERHFAYKVNSTARYLGASTSAEHQFVRDPNDLSPFKERPQHPTVPAKITVGNVRHWMKAHKRSGSESEVSYHNTTSHYMDDSGEDRRSGPEERHSTPTSTEGLAKALLNPRVSSSEAAEYASYVDQFRTLNLSNELSDDMAMYEQAVRISKGMPITVDRSSEEIYEKHRRAPRDLARAGAVNQLATPPSSRQVGVSMSDVSA